MEGGRKFAEHYRCWIKANNCGRLLNCCGRWQRYLPDHYVNAVTSKNTFQTTGKMGSTSIRVRVTVSFPHPTPTRFGPTFRDHLTPAYDEGSPYLKISHDHFHTPAIRHSQLPYHRKLHHLNAEKTSLNSLGFNFARQQGLMRFSEMWRHVHRCHNLPGRFIYPKNGGSTIPRNTATYLPNCLAQAITLPHLYFPSARFEYPLLWRFFVSFLSTST